MTASDEELIAELKEKFRAAYGYRGLDAPQANGLLIIARMGKDHWNAWRRKYRSTPIILSSLNQGDLRGIDFSGFHFPSVEGKPCADFSRSKFVKENDFESARFGDNAIFENCEFDSVSFRGAIFEKHAKFGGAKFSGEANFRQASFDEFANLTAAKFGGSVDFSDCKFGSQSIFENAVFSEQATFVDVSFGESSTFRGTQFKAGAEFKGSSFGDSFHFSPAYHPDQIRFNCINHEKKTVFHGSSHFSGRGLRGEVDFGGCIFSGNAVFSTSELGRRANFEKVEFLGMTEFKGVEFRRVEFIDAIFHENLNFLNTTFNEEITFLRTIFCGNVKFQGRSETEGKLPSFDEIRFLGCWFAKGAVFRGHEFKTTVLFGKMPPREGRDLREVGRVLGIRTKRHHADKTVFLGIPDFHGCKFHQDTSFVGTEFEVPPGNDAARAFRTLKLAMEGLKSSHEEQMFFRLEMEADRPDLPRGRQWISRLYWASSNYGHSLLRPFLTLIGFMVIFGATHGLLTNLYHVTDLSPSLSEFDSERTWQWFRYVLINTFPVPGFDKVQMDLRIGLFGQDGYLAAIATFLEMLHKVISLGCVFLLGLALRNLFKMKS
jgi:uncharacterized protein YjbI with pentapeptide repeats